jgi:hypothetical protein
VAYSIDASFIRSDAGEPCGTDRLDRELLRSGGTASLSRTESELNRRIDVGNVIRQLDPRGRRLARQLMEHRVAELASITGVSRGTLYDRIAELRSSLMRHGIRASSHPTVWSRNQ